MYILNLVLGCWLTEYDEGVKPSNSYLSKTPANKNENNISLEKLVKFWNGCPDHWKCIHYPCRPEHFEVYKKLPPDWNKKWG